VNNGLSSTGDSSNPNVCENTFDKVFLLSCEEVVSYYPKSKERSRSSTDYARSQGVRIYQSVPYSGNAWEWWLRTPVQDSSEKAKIIEYDGSVYRYGGDVFRVDRGIVPALKIKIN
jgi:hypothetical protein